ncbi:MAG TPA: hypothetical protein VMV17_00240 [Streptosporangiaceae bacterium]|nr:hypothetical protein [Streptosporangiaceae bacterium]
MPVLTGEAGPLLMVARSDLVSLLEEACRPADLCRGLTIDSLAQHQDAVAGCDGIASRTRDLAFGPAAGFDTGWVLWTRWTDILRLGPAAAREWWGSGWFFGAYPVPGRMMCAAGGPADAAGGGQRACVATAPSGRPGGPCPRRGRGYQRS